MAELDELERSLVLAQIGLAAPPGVKQRVRAKLGTEALPACSRLPAEGAMAQALKPGALSRAARHGIPAWEALALTGIAFAAGYFIGQHPGRAPDQLATQTSTARTEPGSAELAPHTESSARGDRAASAETPPIVQASPDEPVASSPRPPDLATGRNGTGAKDGRKKARAMRSTRVEAGLATELALLARADRAIRAGNPDLALALLDQLERDLPKPQPQQERQAARLLAECERSTQGVSGSAAPSAAAERARQYLSGHPASVYSERIHTLCGLDVAASNASSNGTSAAATQAAAPNDSEESGLGGH
jgi:hypothetical protein